MPEEHVMAEAGTKKGGAVVAANHYLADKLTIHDERG